MIKAFRHDTRTDILTITFNNNETYEYSGVNLYIFTNFFNAPSRNKYFANQIKNKFICEKV